MLSFIFILAGLLGVLKSAETSVVTVQENENATLPCTVPSGKSAFIIEWRNGKKVVYKKFGSQQYKYSDRKKAYALTGKASLLLSGADRYDHGHYTCLLFLNDQTHKKEDVTLIVKSVPIIQDQSPPRQNINSTKSLSLQCPCTGYPEPVVVWRKVRGILPKDRTQTDTKGKLTISDVTKADSGMYVCTAANEIGSDSKNFTVFVQEPPEIISKRKFHANVGYKAEIKCISKGYPNPHFTWSWRDDNYTKKIQDGEEDERFKVVTRHTNVTSESVLIIQRITRADWRTYTCSAANKWGINSAELQLTGYTRPEPPSIISVKTGTSTAVVKWRFGDDGGLALTSLTLEYRINTDEKWQSLQLTPADRTQYTITELEPDNNYQFRIRAENNLGKSERSVAYIAQTKSFNVHTSSNRLMGTPMTAMIVGIAGGFLALLIMIAAVFCAVRRIQKNSAAANTPPNSRPTSGDHPLELSVFNPNSPQHPLLSTQLSSDSAYGSGACVITPGSHSRWEFPRERLKLGPVLGSGAFGVVMKAQAEGIKGCVGSLPVAVKIVKETDSDTAKKDLLAELELLKLIEPHPNVIGLLGCCTRTDGLMVIVEFCAYGDLQSYLRNSRGIQDKYYKDTYRVPPMKLTSNDLLSFATQVTRGMAHLAAMKVIHRDLAARNILIDENKVIKVSDFGFARDIYVENNYTRKTQGGRFPIKWMAIESLVDGVSTTKSDVWSYGVLLWEIITLGASPYPGMNSQEVVSFLQDGYRMEKPKHCAEELYALLLDCWNVAPQRRPTFTELSRHLNKLMSDDREYINLRSYEDHLYVNFDGSIENDTPTNTQAGSLA